PQEGRRHAASDHTGTDDVVRCDRGSDSARRRQMKLSRLVLTSVVLLLLTAGRASAFNIPPFATDHEVFQSDDRDDNPDDTNKNCSTGSPIEVSTGNYLRSFPIVSIPGRGPGLDLTLSYRSLDRRKGPFGTGWTSSYDQRVIKATDGVEITAICAG